MTVAANISQEIYSQIRDSIVVSISACHAEDPGSIPGRGVLSQTILLRLNSSMKKVLPDSFHRLTASRGGPLSSPNNKCETIEAPAALERGEEHFLVPRQGGNGRHVISASAVCRLCGDTLTPTPHHGSLPAKYAPRELAFNGGKKVENER